ncbi:MAG TPA: hypothetical protein VE177_06900, partial [Candidatus Binatus sp.]|nr:hypothetical protein [Candidatus Binatus sp.]
FSFFPYRDKAMEFPVPVILDSHDRGKEKIHPFEPHAFHIDLPKKPADVSTASEKLPCLTHMKPNREKIEAEELVKERLPLTKWELTPKEKEDFNRVMRLMFDAASILRYDLELGEDAIGKTLKELADWATN